MLLLTPASTAISLTVTIGLQVGELFPELQVFDIDILSSVFRKNRNQFTFTIGNIGDFPDRIICLSEYFNNLHSAVT